MILILFQLRVYELVWPLHLKINELETIRSSLQSCNSAKDLQIENKDKEYHQLSLNLCKTQEKLDDCLRECSFLKEQQSTDDFKLRNFDRIKEERDRMNKKLSELVKKFDDLQVYSSGIKKEKDTLNDRFSDLNLKYRKQEQDLSHYRGEIYDKKSKLEEEEVENKSLSQNLKQEQDKSSKIHDKYVEVVEKVTILDMNLKDSVHEVKILKEKLQHVSHSEKELKLKLQNITSKYEETISEVNEYKLRYRTEKDFTEAELIELRNSLSLVSKAKENLFKENTKILNDLHHLKDLLNQEKINREKDVSILSQRLQRAKDILSRYETLDQEYNESIRTAASVPEAESKNIINKLMPGLSIPGYKAIEQTVNLTRKVLKLERDNTEACQTIQQLTEGIEKLGATIMSYKSALCMAGQPSSRLLQHIASQDEQINALQTALNSQSSQNENFVEKINSLNQNIKEYEINLIKSNQQIREVEDIKRNLKDILKSISSLSNR